MQLWTPACSVLINPNCKSYLARGCLIRQLRKLPPNAMFAAASTQYPATRTGSAAPQAHRRRPRPSQSACLLLCMWLSLLLLTSALSLQLLHPRLADASRALGEASELPPAVFHSRHLSGDTVKVTLQPAPGGGGGSSGGGGGSLVSLGKRVTVATGSAIVSVDEDQGRWVYGALRGGMQVVRLICTAAVGQVWQ
ncbi:hypothetical protein Vretifemale_17854 [Volvox reticuliferus]|uniref:Uncharacterized protein n=1 Tax=Volvox reticuliferus TaxID=1737510 RepID=A0A8J4CWH5_9CHLO|nr:hypothetical protein Vretifemale_17854 [Volvox reticuliferus]